MFDGLIIWLGYVLIGAFGLTLVCGLLLASYRRWGPPKLRVHLKSQPYGCALPVLFLLIILIGVGWALMPVEQHESIKTVSAYSVSLASEKDRSDFLQVLRAAANDQGMHVDAGSREELEAMAKEVPQARMTIHAAIWKDANEKESVAVIMDLGHLHDAWIMFSKGTDPQFNIRFRDRVMREIMRRWPNTLSLPILPTGGLPVHGDLVRTFHGYIINPAAASKYSSEGQKP